MTCISRTAAAVLATASVALLGACATDTKTPAAPPAKTQPAEKKSGILADIAPTILDLAGLPQPPAMTGRSLIAK